MSGRAGRKGSPPLLERDRELTALDGALAAAAARHGRLVVLAGEAGIGKSRLLGAARERAEAAGLSVLEACATELERDFALGVALQLFEPSLVNLAPRARNAVMSGAASLAKPLFAAAGSDTDAAPDGQGGGQDFSLLHGLYWLTANLAERGPLLIVVDDLQSADVSSLRFLHYLIHRVEDLPVAVVLATRPAGGGRGEVLALTAHPAAEVLALAPLSAPAAARLVEEAFSAADPSFTGSCVELTRGNPFLLRELLRSLADDGAVPDAATGQRMAAYEIAPQTIVRSTALRLARLPASATALARAVAILGDDARASRAATVAGLDIATAAAALDALDAIGMIRASEPLGFAHPLIAAAVAAGIPAGERAAGHRSAAELLRAEGADEGRLASHLLRASSAGDVAAVETLRMAAARAARRGAPGSAVRHLQRALDEPPPPGLRAEVLIDLGEARAAAGGERAAEAFEAALSLLESRHRRAEVRWKLGRLLYAQGRHSDAGKQFERARSEVVDRDPALARRLGFAALTTALVTQSTPAQHPGDTRARVDELISEAGRGTLPPDELAPLVGVAGMAGVPREAIVGLAEQALDDGTLIETAAADQGHAVAMIAIGLLYADELARSQRMLDDALAQARARGALLAVATLSYARAWPLYFRGRLADAVADAEQARDARSFGWQMYPVAAAAVLAHALIELGDLAAARAALDGESPAGRGAEWTMLLGARGRLLLAEHDPSGALAQLDECGRMLAEVGVATRPQPWRSRAALAAAALGDHPRAERLVCEELAAARAVGAPRPIGVALRTAGLLAARERRVELLREAVSTLERSDARLELARALIDLGAAQRREGERAASREPLRRGLELAHGFGAAPLVAQARDELRATGARPRRLVLAGAASLTASERRVAEMAAAGLTNRQIAQSLFVTTKAVEFHLRNVYRKLEIQRRRQLPEALADG